MSRTLFLFLWVVAAWADPPCNRKLAGAFDPPEAAHDATVRREAIRCGTLRICTRNVWRYRWERVSVPYSELAGKGKVCEVRQAAAPQPETAGQ